MGEGRVAERTLRAVVTALMGFHSATVRNQPARLSVGMYVRADGGRRQR